MQDFHWATEYYNGHKNLSSHVQMCYNHRVHLEFVQIILIIHLYLRGKNNKRNFIKKINTLKLGEWTVVRQIIWPQIFDQNDVQENLMHLTITNQPCQIFWQPKLMVTEVGRPSYSQFYIQFLHRCPFFIFNFDYRMQTWTLWNSQWRIYTRTIIDCV